MELESCETGTKGKEHLRPSLMNAKSLFTSKSYIRSFISRNCWHYLMLQPKKENTVGQAVLSTFLNANVKYGSIMPSYTALNLSEF